MRIKDFSRKDTGSYGEKVALVYLQRNKFVFVDKNVVKKTGEIDIIVKKEGILHFVEVKTIMCRNFPGLTTAVDAYDPSANLHRLKLQKVRRTSEWYMADVGWEGECQIDGILVWLREADGVARVRYLPHIL